jgi:serine/threonine protein kinase
MAGENNYLCALQYPKYTEDLEEFMERSEIVYENHPKERPNIKAIIQRIEEDLFKNMYSLHGHGIVHLDIKTRNIALNKHARLSFADWGFAAFLENEDSLHYAFQNLEDYVSLYKRYACIFLEDETIQLFPSKMFDVLTEPNMDGIHFLNQDMVNVVYKLVLSFVDRICVCSVVLRLYFFLVPDLFEEKRVELKKYLFETYDALNSAEY